MDQRTCLTTSSKLPLLDHALDVCDSVRLPWESQLLPVCLHDFGCDCLRGVLVVPTRTIRPGCILRLGNRLSTHQRDHSLGESGRIVDLVAACHRGNVEEQSRILLRLWRVL